ncbi:MAG: hypothetical protein II937_00555 [Bacteroidales bacterium]|nr:hypothetical protein [Bacteroidales bacterium]
MKRLIILTAIICLLAACHKDDDEYTPPEPQASKIQIMTVFAPGQLGDRGYADRVMKGVNALQQDNTIHADIEFMTSYDIKTLQTALLDWAQNTTSSPDGTPYSRRLLVMTELYMAKWFAGMTSALRDGDEILLLKATQSDAQKAAQILGAKIPVYALNISAASSVRTYARTYIDFLEQCGQSSHIRNISVYRLYNQETGLYRDSLVEALQETLQLAAPPAFSHMLDTEGELYSTDIAGSLFEKVYETCASTLFARAEKDAYDLFSIIDFGSSNSGADFYLMGKNSNCNILPIMFDCEYTNGFQRFNIIRHFDRALSQWIERWLRSQPSEMPLAETHGGWDGFCTEYIDDIAIEFKIRELTSWKTQD